MTDALTADAIVIGAGLAGLTAAIHLQRAGARTVVIEQRATAGGLCSAFELEGHRFVYGCNDFGTGLARELGELGVDVEFLYPRSRFYIDDDRLDVPANAAMLRTLAPRALSIARAVRGALRPDTHTLGELIDRHVRDPLLRDFCAVLACSVMRTPDDIELAVMKTAFDRSFHYGYDRATTPRGGPQHMVDRMVRRFEELGGTLLFDTRCVRHSHENGLHSVETTRGPWTARALLSSEGRWSEYPPSSRSGLEVALLLFALDSSVQYPAEHHTIGFFVRDMATLLRRLDQGERCEPCSFHVFRSDLREPAGRPWTLSGFVPMPRGVRTMTADETRRLLASVRQRLECAMPGFVRATKLERVIFPDEYERRFGFAPLPSPRVAPRGTQRLPSFDRERSVFLLGNSAGPPGDHAGAAVLSGKLAAIDAARSLSIAHTNS